MSLGILKDKLQRYKMDGRNSLMYAVCSFGEVCPKCGAFCVFMAESNEGVEELLIKFARGTKLEGSVSMSGQD